MRSQAPTPTMRTLEPEPVGQPAGDPAAAPVSNKTDAPATDTPIAGGITEADTAAAKKIVDGFSTEELAGSVIMMTYQDTDHAAAAQLIEQHHLAGSIVMSNNLGSQATMQDVRATTSALAAPGQQRGWPVLIGVDQEGGPVARLRSATMPFPPLMAAGAVRNKDTVTVATATQGAQLRDAGFTIDFAPVADVTIGAKDPAINVRSAAGDQDLAASTVAAAVTGYSQAGIGSAAKHFPGHGSLTVDSHESLPVSTKSLKELSATEFEPFRAAAEAGVPMVMVGHIGLPGDETLPADLNPAVYDALREDVGFDGVAITDALNMGAITQSNAAVKAIKAGADLALMPTDTAGAAQSMVAAIEDGTLPRERVEEASTRVVAMSLWQQRAASQSQASGDNPDDVLSAYADESLTVLAGECTVASPLTRATVVGDDTVAVSRLSAALEDHGVSVGSGPVVSVGQTAQSGASVVVGIGGPWSVDRAARVGADTVIDTYSDNTYAMDAAARYLTGQLEATAQVPFKVRSNAPDCG